ncbi:hypothetical protein PIB30_088882 [Stylosanthes scabra]|uniref:Uncharacterized protein n=1 Tax=Stylosanthes scabra TaxID=79078 RepID=A0ABU6WXE5_9FABA|nr:hypothetical protein [Stylosanthes scabra]
MARQSHESKERYPAMHDELNRRNDAKDADVEELKQHLREELQLIQAIRRQMGATGKHMHVGASSIAGGGSSSSAAAQDPPLHPPPPPAPQEDADADYVDP